MWDVKLLLVKLIHMKQQTSDPAVAVSLGPPVQISFSPMGAAVCAHINLLFTASELPLSLRTVSVTPPPCACWETTKFIREPTGMRRYTTAS